MFIILDRDARQHAATSLISEQSHLREEQRDWREEAIVAIALCAVICGADGWVEIAEFGKAKEAWFATILDAARHPLARYLWAGVRGVFPGVGRGRGGTTRA
jgi:hypothetical protein